MARDQECSIDGVSRRKFIVTTGAVGAAGVAGCGGDGEGGDGEGGEGGDGSDGGDGSSGGDGGDMDLSGNIRVSGSSTVFPVATAVGELFKEDHPDVTFDISKDGSSGGFENVFIPGDSDINNSSRAIKDEEVQTLRDNGIEPVEFEVAKDALTVVVNNENDFIDSLTYDELEQIWSPDDKAETWSDVNSDWPDEPIDLYGPASTSGTFDYFTETILGEAGRIRDDFEGTEEDDQIASGVEGNEYAMGYLPFAYYVNNPEETTAVPLATEAGEEPTDPSLDAASTGEYPLARPLFFYGNMNKIQEKGHVQAFIQFYIQKTTDKQLIADRIGYVQSSDQRAQQNQANLEAAITGDYEFSR
ncbi:phosphate ABC transporter substrate-binding protein [Halobacteriales archaeon QH_10_67_22]|nr:MAG: phosphate ABC transporter substrate-binding protein [Halobacteriales archaeon QH_10_67_22]